MISDATALQYAARMLMSVLAPDLARIMTIAITFGDFDTAATDGNLHIAMPDAFLGVPLPKNASVTLGLLVHELGHWLQPVAKVSEVEKAETLPHWFANIALDIQGEALIESLFPHMKEPLRSVRQVVRKKNSSRFYDQLKQVVAEAKSSGWTLARKATAAQLGMLIGRFDDPSQPYAYSHKVASAFPLPRDVDELLFQMGSFRKTVTGRLPQKFAEFAKRYPFLRTPIQEIELPWPETRERDDDPMARIFRKALEDAAREVIPPDKGRASLSKVTRLPPQYTYPEAKQLASRLVMRFQAKSGGVDVTAPGRLERLDMARGHPAPFAMHLPGKASPAPMVVLVIDASGSMWGDRLTNAMKGAQAIALAVQAAGGEVKSIMFDDKARYREDAGLLFAEYRWVNDHFGGSTSFRFLEKAWRLWPEHLFIVLTDGYGKDPSILPIDRKRTSAVFIGSGGSSAIPWADKTVHLQETGDLAAVFATLIPRRFTQY